MLVLTGWLSSPDLERRWHWWWLLVAAGTTLAAVAQYPFSRRIVLASLTRLVPPEKAAEAWSGVQLWLLLGIAVSPLTVLLKAAVYAALLYLVAVAAGRAVRFRRLLALVLIALIPLVVELWCVLGVLYVSGLERVETPDDLKVALGLDRFLDSTAPWAVIAGQLNPFQASFMGVLFVGLTSGGMLSPRAAAAGIGGLWLAASFLAERIQALSRIWTDLIG
jgi:hypothetical protein